MRVEGDEEKDDQVGAGAVEERECMRADGGEVGLIRCCGRDARGDSARARKGGG